MRILVILIALCTLAACRNTTTPEAQVRATIAKAEAAAESKDIATLRALVSDRYTDDHGQDKRAIEGMLRYYFLRHQSIHLFTQIQSVTLPEQDRASAVVYVGMAAQPVASAEELARLRADLYRFEIQFAREDDAWRVQGAQWRPAELIDFVR
jgi:hypothetical protein